MTTHPSHAPSNRDPPRPRDSVHAPDAPPMDLRPRPHIAGPSTDPPIPSSATSFPRDPSFSYAPPHDPPPRSRSRHVIPMFHVIGQACR
ncbi:hypothetical protein chiPu_0032496 [Chiloscyllium punctatum]|uniref:Uncharacterized protein n=1 Tax=Chiloscyllium punctatum TaxID=137246 RepID=A0A401TZX3_CHIPU|nr:hypothetical protein [Chiloscyllium punctatum]